LNDASRPLTGSQPFVQSSTLQYNLKKAQVRRGPAPIRFDAPTAAARRRLWSSRLGHEFNTLDEPLECRVHLQRSVACSTPSPSCSDLNIFIAVQKGQRWVALAVRPSGSRSSHDHCLFSGTDRGTQTARAPAPDSVLLFHRVRIVHHERNKGHIAEALGRISGRASQSQGASPERTTAADG
jgi:hypothetical protein